ncbi:MAG: hypothetical protein ACO3QZ_05400 [Candidatus Nanopelagicaceae bacterium]
MKYGHEYYAIVDINGETDKHVWTLTREQLNAVVSLLMEKGNDELADLGLSIGRAVRALSVKAGA